MIKGILIADSGGTSTKWVHSENSDWSFSMESLHPRRLHELSEQRKVELNAFFSTVEFEEVHFYGAGCSSKEAKESLKLFLNEIGINSKDVHLKIETDALLACRAALGTNAGYVAILGTGSILMQYNGKEIVSTYGGFGSIIGDEGSAMSFGKLFLKEYLLDPSQFDEEIRQTIGEKSTILGELAKNTALVYISSLAEKLAKFELDAIHELNIKRFFELYLPSENQGKMSFVGSYAFFQGKNIKKNLEAYEWGLGTIIQDPLTSIRTTYKSLFL
jgi:N-acetylglucosamine kinase-like BadF-type ATPase